VSRLIRWLSSLFTPAIDRPVIIADALPPRLDMRTRISADGVFALPGEAVVCERGHHIATFIDRADVGQAWNSGLLSFDGRTPMPTTGTTMEQCLCAECGGLWVMGGNLHFKDGWR
jgi:hypothetical protein